MTRRSVRSSSGSHGDVMALGQPIEVFQAHEAEKVRDIRQMLQDIIDYVRANELTLPVVMTIDEAGIKAKVEIT